MMLVINKEKCSTRLVEDIRYFDIGVFDRYTEVKIISSLETNKPGPRWHFTIFCLILFMYSRVKVGVGVSQTRVERSPRSNYRVQGW